MEMAGGVLLDDEDGLGEAGPRPPGGSGVTPKSRFSW